ncbi:hypothetical protein GCM10011588_66250 [Nocardia jinanensis]|uniref:Uncharacterized protein n=1 Tax=Nocardia jinanensis TaxID=382504 RepID=A0A917RWK7_9NOCA|nr:hypothetical protein GCM10011588_66250 [Nocardia jinanensis]
MSKSLVWGLALESAVGSVAVVIVVPLFEFGVEDVYVVDDDAIEKSIELLGADAV